MHVRTLLALIAVGLGLSCLSGASVALASADDVPLTRLLETFKGPSLDTVTWAVTRSGDFQESVADLVDGRLRLRLGTLETRDDTVKYLGIRTRRPIDLKRCRSVSFELDWNDQQNGCYLDAGLYLCPTKTDTTPELEPNWLRLVYVGVPPGRNARAWLSVRRDGAERVLHDDGWPARQRTGRPIGRQMIVLRWDGRSLAVQENGRLLCRIPDPGLRFSEAYLYLQMSSHSNYPPREVLFDNLRVRSVISRE